MREIYNYRGERLAYVKYTHIHILTYWKFEQPTTNHTNSAARVDNLKLFFHFHDQGRLGIYSLLFSKLINTRVQI